MRAEQWGEYFFLGFAPTESGFIDNFCCKLPSGGGMCKLIAFGEATLGVRDDTFPRYLPLMYLLTVTPRLSFSSTTVYSE